MVKIKSAFRERKTWKNPKEGDIKWLKKPNVQGHTWKKYEKVTRIDMSGKKEPKTYKKWVGYW